MIIKVMCLAEPNIQLELVIINQLLSPQCNVVHLSFVHGIVQLARLQCCRGVGKDCNRVGCLTYFCNWLYHLKIKMSDRNFTQRFDVVMTSLSSDKKITVQQCYICSVRFINIFDEASLTQFWGTLCSTSYPVSLLPLASGWEMSIQGNYRWDCIAKTYPNAIWVFFQALI